MKRNTVTESLKDETQYSYWAFKKCVPVIEFSRLNKLTM